MLRRIPPDSGRDSLYVGLDTSLDDVIAVRSFDCFARLKNQEVFIPLTIGACRITAFNPAGSTEISAGMSIETVEIALAAAPRSGVNVKLAPLSSVAAATSGQKYVTIFTDQSTETL